MVANKCTLIAATVALFATAALAQGNSRYHSAKCVELGKACPPFFATRSGACKAGVAPTEQPDECNVLACRWCALPGKAALAPCTAATLRTLCDLDGEQPQPSPVSVPDFEAQPSGQCAWTGDDSVVIPFDRVRAASGWTSVTRDGMRGLVFRKDLNHGIVQPGKGEMCFEVRTKQGGDYFATVVSYTPEHTENNDMWFKVSKPLLLMKVGDDSRSFERAPNTFLKAYQNDMRRMSTKLHTKDHDAHHFVVRGVGADETIRACVDGRSFRYEVYKLVFMRCSGMMCKGAGMDKEAVMKMGDSRCM